MGKDGISHRNNQVANISSEIDAEMPTLQSQELWKNNENKAASGKTQILFGVSEKSHENHRVHVGKGSPI